MGLHVLFYCRWIFKHCIFFYSMGRHSTALNNKFQSCRLFDLKQFYEWCCSKLHFYHSTTLFCCRCQTLWTSWQIFILSESMSFKKFAHRAIFKVIIGLEEVILNNHEKGSLISSWQWDDVEKPSKTTSLQRVLFFIFDVIWKMVCSGLPRFLIWKLGCVKSVNS